MTRRQTLLLFLVLTVLLSIPLSVQAAEKSTPPPLPPSHRIIVKLSIKMASSMENSMTASKMEIEKDTASLNARLFFSKHKIKKMMPAFKEIVAWKKRTGRTEADFVSRIKTKYALRAQRYRGTNGTPEMSRIYIIEPEGSSEKEFQATLKELRKDTNVVYAEPEKIATVQMIPNDPYFSSRGSWGQDYDDLDGLKNINASDAWNISTGRGITVAVVDTGIDQTHPDIAANVWKNSKEIPGNGVDDDQNGYIDDTWGWNFVTNTNQPIDDHGHGTHVAGTIAAVGNNGIGIIGVAPEAKVMAVKTLASNGSGYDSWIADAIIYAANNGADVINASLSGQGDSSIVEDAVNYAHSLGVVIVVAAGNDNEDVRYFFPASFNNAITVGAATSSLGPSKADFSNWGNKLDFIAPGMNILSLKAAGTAMGTSVGDGYTVASGTSMATPHVAGAVALVLAIHPGFSNEQVRQVLRITSKDVIYNESDYVGHDLLTGEGIIDLFKVVNVGSALEVKIDNPRYGSLVTGQVLIAGSAKGTNFSHYILEYGSGNDPHTWMIIQQGNTPVDKGTLGVFDATAVPDGVYTLRLTAKDSSNSDITYKYKIELEVKYMEMISPKLPRVPSLAREYKTGFGVPIEGTANGPSFQRFRLEWAEGYEPTDNWSSTGFVLENNGNTPVIGGKIATWDSSVTTGRAGYYQIKLLVDNGGFTSETRTFVYVEPDLISSNWPQYLDNSPSELNSVVAALDEDGQNSLILNLPQYFGSENEPSFNRYSSDGSLQFSMPYKNGFYMQPAVGDLDRIPGDEGVFLYDGLYNQSEAIFKIVKPDNTTSEFSSHSLLNFSQSPILLQDLDGDMIPEILTLGEDVENRTQSLFVWKQDGSLFTENFPLLPVNDKVTDFDIKVRVLTVDLDNDGKKEIILYQGDAPRSTSLKLFNWDGTPRAWAKSEPTFSDGVIQNMMAGDMDRDGQVELILLVVEVDPAVLYTFLSKVYVLNPDGSVKPGWPVKLDDGCRTIKIADMDRDGNDEIVCGSGLNIVILKYDGSLFKTIALQNYLLGFSIGDVNGDTYPEMVGYSQSWQAYRPESRAWYYQRDDIFYSIVVIDKDAHILKTWQIFGLKDEPASMKSDPVLGDFNNDGKVDVAITYGLTVPGSYGLDWVVHGGIAVYSLDADYNAEYMDWPMNNHDPQNSNTKLPKLTLNDIKLDGTAYYIGVGLTKNPILKANYSNGRSKDVTRYATYSIENNSIASVDAFGVITGLIPGVTTLTASYEGKSVTAQITVGVLSLQSIRMDSTQYAIAAGLTKQIVVTAEYSDNTTVDVTGEASYQTDDPSIATVDANGCLHGITQGSTLITANYGGKSVTVPVTIHAPIVQAIQLDATQYMVSAGLAKQVAVTAEYSDDSTSNVTSSASYQTSNPTVATVDASGVIKGLIRGTTILTINYSGKTTTAEIIVMDPELLEIDFTSPSYRVLEGMSTMARVTATYSDNSTKDVTSSVTYSMTLTGSCIANVDTSGKITGVSKGISYIHASYLGKTASATVVVDNQPLITVNDCQINEDNSGTVNAAFTITLASANDQTVTVNYATADGTAKAGVDYTVKTGTLTFAPGVTTQTVNVAVKGDTLSEANETFYLNLSGAVYANIQDNQGIGTIIDDDSRPSLTVADVVVTEGAAGTMVNAHLKVTLSAVSGQTVTVDYETVDGTAVTGQDYQSKNGTLTFAPGQLSKTISVIINGDALDEINEKCTINFSNLTGATMSDPQGTISITDDDAAPTMAIGSSTVTEGNDGTTDAVITVSLSKASGRTVTVNYATANISAKAGTDYQAQSGTLTFAPGMTVQTITVPILGDVLDEGNEKLAVNLSGAVGAVLNKTPTQGIVTITDDDPLPNLSIDDPSVTEGDSGTLSAVLTVTLSAPSAKMVTVKYATANGTAKYDKDYLVKTGVLTFAPGVTTRKISVPIKGERLCENDETLVVNLSSPVNAVVTDAQGVVTIADNDPLPSIKISDVKVTEGNKGTVKATATVTLSAVCGRTVSVNYGTVDDTAKAGVDYTAKTGTIQFAPGVVTQTVTITINCDTLDEYNNKFYVHLSDAVNAAIGDADGAITIVDDDAAATLIIRDVTILEGNEGTAEAVVTLSLSKITGRTVTANYATADGSAKAGSDYMAQTGTLTFAPGETIKTITLTVNNDLLDEANEKFYINLSSIANAAYTDPQGAVTITDDDAAPTLSIDDVSVTEGNSGTTYATFTVTLSAVSGKTVTVKYATVNGTAKATYDYTAKTGTLTFAPGVATQTIKIAVKGETVKEKDESFSVALNGAVNVTVSDGTGQAVIVNDDL